MESTKNNTWLHFLFKLSRYVDSKISHSGTHSITVAQQVHSIAARMGCNEKDIQILYWAALLHDIGKVGVPENVLSKAGPLTDQEWVTMKLHPTVGANILKAVNGIGYVAPVVLTHQEKFDGTGYPFGLQGQDIPLGARILAVLDAFDAMTSDRVYRKAFSLKEAVEELQRGNGKHFDPDVVEVFLDSLQSQ